MSDSVRRIQILLVGDSGAGKTSLINRHKYDLYTEKTRDIIGQAQPYKVFIDDVTIELCLLESPCTEVNKTFHDFAANCSEDLCTEYLK